MNTDSKESIQIEILKRKVNELIIRDLEKDVFIGELHGNVRELISKLGVINKRVAEIQAECDSMNCGPI